jgi:hypothetical protein
MRKLNYNSEDVKGLPYKDTNGIILHYIAEELIDASM